MPAKCKVCEFESELSEDFNSWKATETTPINIYPILPRGNPRKTPWGFICARCLRDARMSRSFIKTVASGIVITKHVLDRYIERCKIDHFDRETTKISLAKEFYYAKKIRFKDKYIAERFLNNGCKEANYFCDGGFIYVATKHEKPPVLLTVEPVGNKKNGQDFWYEEEQE